MTTLVYRMFRTVPLSHLERSLFSIAHQNWLPSKLLLFDDSPYSESEIRRVIAKYFSPDAWELYFARHHDTNKTLAWANNTAIRLCDTENFILARADMIYDPSYCEKLMGAYAGPLTYSTCWMYQMQYDLDHDPNPKPAPDLEQFDWRTNVQNLLKNTEGSRGLTQAEIDGPSFCTSKAAFELSCYDETLIGWGYEQQDFQRQLVLRGVNMKVVPEYLSFHMSHPADRDKDKALELWKRSPRRVPDILAEEARQKTEQPKQTE